MGSCMQSRHRYSFRPDVEYVFFDNPTLQSDSYQKLTFAADFWQPFIDEVFNNETGAAELSGPFLGFLLEFAKKYRMVLEYVDNINLTISEHYEMLKRGRIDVFLLPTPPLKMSRWDEFEPSIPIGSVKMISFLSAKFEAPKPLFRFAQCFSAVCWISILASFLTSSLVSMVINSINSIKKQDEMSRNIPISKPRFTKELLSALFSNLRTLLSQPLSAPLRRLNRPKWLLDFCWKLASIVLVWSWSSKLLEFTAFPAPFNKIDSLNDVLRFLEDGDIESVVTFADEAFHDLINENNEKARFLKQRTQVFDGNKFEFERFFPDIQRGSVVLVADDAFLDYYYNAFLHKFRSFYQSKQNLVPLPFVMPLRRKNPVLNQLFDKLIRSLFETGIYQMWIDETLLANNLAMKLNLKESDSERAPIEPLNVVKFYGLLILSVAGLLLATFSFVVEFKFSKDSSKLFGQITKEKDVGLRETQNLTIKLEESLVNEENKENVTKASLIDMEYLTINIFSRKKLNSN